MLGKILNMQNSGNFHIKRPQRAKPMRRTSLISHLIYDKQDHFSTPGKARHIHIPVWSVNEDDYISELLESPRLL